MSISLSRYVDITSGVAGQSAVVLHSQVPANVQEPIKPSVGVQSYIGFPTTVVSQYSSGLHS